MLGTSAVAIVNDGMTFKPGWQVEAAVTERHETTIRVTVNYPAQQSERDQYPEYPTEVNGGARAAFFLMVEDCDTISDLFYLLLTQVILPIETHEHREFMRVHPTGWAPFHPHRSDGIKNWTQYSGQPAEFDLKFGLTRY